MRVHRDARLVASMTVPYCPAALTAEETEQALAAGAAVAREEIAAGAQLLISGDMGIGNTTPAAAAYTSGKTRVPSV